jgi:hypothetical protein
MRQAEPVLHEPEEPIEIVAEDPKLVVSVPVAIAPNIRIAKARPAIAVAAKAAR